MIATKVAVLSVMAFTGPPHASVRRSSRCEQSAVRSIEMGRRGQPPAFMNPNKQATSGVAPPLPEDGIPMFYLFVRSPDIGFWYPLTAMKGDKPTRDLVDSYIGNTLASGLAKEQLDAGIAKSIFHPPTMKKLTEEAVKQFKPLKPARDRLQFGYKIGDKAMQEKVKKGEMEEPKITLLTEDMTADQTTKVQKTITNAAENVWNKITGKAD